MLWVRKTAATSCMIEHAQHNPQCQCSALLHQAAPQLFAACDAATGFLSVVVSEVIAISASLSMQSQLRSSDRVFGLA